MEIGFINYDSENQIHCHFNFVVGFNCVLL